MPGGWLRILGNAALLLAAPLGPAAAATISQGPLAVTIGALDGTVTHLTFHGNEFFRHGWYTADFLLQEGDDSRTEARNTPEPFLDSRMAFAMLHASHDTLTTRGLYESGSSPVEVVRTYRLVPGFDRLEITTGLRNVGTGTIAELRFMESFDPDPGENYHHLTDMHFLAFATVNDVRRIDGVRVATAFEPYDLPEAPGHGDHGHDGHGHGEQGGTGGVTMANAALAMALTAYHAPDVTLGFHQHWAPSINAFLGGVIDPDGTLGDLSVNVATVFANLAPGDTARLTIALGFGVDARAAVAALGVPLPGAAALLATALGGLGLLTVRRRRPTPGPAAAGAPASPSRAPPEPG